jgi:hypothetical protein
MFNAGQNLFISGPRHAYGQLHSAQMIIAFVKVYEAFTLWPSVTGPYRSVFYG